MQLDIQEQASYSVNQAATYMTIIMIITSLHDHAGVYVTKKHFYACKNMCITMACNVLYCSLPLKYLILMCDPL